MQNKKKVNAKNGKKNEIKQKQKQSSDNKQNIFMMNNI